MFKYVKYFCIKYIYFLANMDLSLYWWEVNKFDLCLILWKSIYINFGFNILSYWEGQFFIPNSRKNEGMEPKQKQHPAVDRTGDRSKVRCCKEQHCRGTWNVRSINQGKLEVVKQEMARVNIDFLGISKLRWIGMGEFNSDDHYISTTVGRNPLEEME